MISGIKTKPDGDYCAYCNAKLINVYEFCPKCGNALTLDAVNLRGQREKSIKIELLDELASEMADEKSLKAILKKLNNI